MLTIMRHGKTDWNAQFRLQGQTDIPLNDEGRSMAVAARNKYPDMKFDLCFSSPLRRAKETAELFLEGTNTPIIIDDRLKEVNFGEYEGVAHSFQIPELNVNKFFLDTVNYVPDKNAESIEELYSRTGAFLRDEIFTRINWNADFIDQVKWEEALDGRRPFRYGMDVNETINEAPLLWPVLPDREADEMNILIVGHGAMNCSIINQLWKVPLTNYWNYMHDNCKLIRLI